MRQFDVGLELQQRTTGLADEESKASVGTPTLAFGDIGGNRSGGAPDLTGEAKSLGGWKIACGQVNCTGQLNGALPDLKVAEIASFHAIIEARLRQLHKSTKVCQRRPCPTFLLPRLSWPDFSYPDFS